MLTRHCLLPTYNIGNSISPNNPVTTFTFLTNLLLSLDKLQLIKIIQNINCNNPINIFHYLEGYRELHNAKSYMAISNGAPDITFGYCENNIQTKIDKLFMQKCIASIQADHAKKYSMLLYTANCKIYTQLILLEKVLNCDPITGLRLALQLITYLETCQSTPYIKYLHNLLCYICRLHAIFQVDSLNKFVFDNIKYKYISSDWVENMQLHLPTLDEYTPIMRQILCTYAHLEKDYNYITDLNTLQTLTQTLRKHSHLACLYSTFHNDNTSLTRNQLYFL